MDAATEAPNEIAAVSSTLPPPALPHAASPKSAAPAPAPLHPAYHPPQSVHVSSQDVRSAASAAIVPTHSDSPPDPDPPLLDGPASWEDQVDAADLAKYKPKHVPSPNQPSLEQPASNGNQHRSHVPSSPASLTLTAQPLSAPPINSGAQSHSPPTPPAAAAVAVASVSPFLASVSASSTAPPLIAFPSAAVQPAPTSPPVAAPAASSARDSPRASATPSPSQLNPVPKASPRLVPAKPDAPAKPAAKAATAKARSRHTEISPSAMAAPPLMSFPFTVPAMPLYPSYYSSSVHHAPQQMTHAWQMPPPQHDASFNSRAHADAAAAGREAALQDTIRDLKEQITRQDKFLCERSEREDQLQQRLAEALEQITQLEERELRHCEREKERRAQKHEELLEAARQDEQRSHLAQMQMRARADTPATPSSSGLSPVPCSPFLRSLLSTPLGDSCLNVNLAGDMLASLPPPANGSSGASRFSGTFRRIFSAVDPFDFERSKGGTIDRFCSAELTMLHARQANASWDGIPPANSNVKDCASPISMSRAESVVTPPFRRPSVTNGSADSSAASSAVPSPRANIWTNSPLLDAHQPPLILPRVFKLHSASPLDAMAPPAAQPPDPALWALMDAHAVSFPHGIRTAAAAAAEVIVKPAPVLQATPAPSFSSAPTPAASVSMPSVSSSSPVSVATPAPPPPSRVSAWTKPLVLDVPAALPTPAPAVASVATPSVVLKAMPVQPSECLLPSPTIAPNARLKRAQKVKQHSKVSGTKLRKKANATKPASSAKTSPSVTPRSPPRTRPATPVVSAATSRASDLPSHDGPTQPPPHSSETAGEDPSPTPQPPQRSSLSHADAQRPQAEDTGATASSVELWPNDAAALSPLTLQPPAHDGAVSSSAAAAPPEPEPAPAHGASTAPASPSPLLPPPLPPVTVDSANTPVVMAASTGASPSLSPHALEFTPRPSPDTAATASAAATAADATITATSLGPTPLPSPAAAAAAASKSNPLAERDTPRAVEPASAPPLPSPPLHRSVSVPVPLLLPHPPLNHFPPPAAAPAPHPFASLHSAPFAAHSWHPHPLAYTQSHLPQYSSHPPQLPAPLHQHPPMRMQPVYFFPHAQMSPQQPHHPQQQQQHPTLTTQQPAAAPYALAMPMQYGGGATMHATQQQHAQQMHAQQQAAVAASQRGVSYSPAYGFAPPPHYWPMQ